MAILMPVLVGILVAIGLYLMLSRNALSIFVGLVILSHGINLLIFSSADIERGAPPHIRPDQQGEAADPVVQALILTAIVIGLGVQSFLLVLVYRLIEKVGSPDLDLVRDTEPGEPATQDEGP